MTTSQIGEGASAGFFVSRSRGYDFLDLGSCPRCFVSRGQDSARRCRNLGWERQRRGKGFPSMRTIRQSERNGNVREAEKWHEAVRKRAEEVRWVSLAVGTACFAVRQVVSLYQFVKPFVAPLLHHLLP